MPVSYPLVTKDAVEDTFHSVLVDAYGRSGQTKGAFARSIDVKPALFCRYLSGEYAAPFHVVVNAVRATSGQVVFQVKWPASPQLTLVQNG